MSKRYIALAAGLVLLTALILLGMGRVPICECGYVKAWHGVTSSSENSQHLADWYTFSHIIHGFGFYALLWLIGRRFAPQRKHRSDTGLGLRFVLAVALESAWEILENTPLIINRYRATTIALDYYGDSVVNSIADIGWMTLGFVLASRLPVWLIVVLTIVMEVAVGLWIRDNLTLNIIQLIYPLDFILEWQRGS